MQKFLKILKDTKLYLLVLVTVLLSVRCAPNKEVVANREFFKGDYQAAAQKYKEIVDEKYKKKDLSYIIYLMNYGAINHYMGNYEEARKAFWAAYQIEYEKRSTGAKAYELVKGTSKRVYRLSKRERALLHFYLGLEFLYEKDLTNALVEFRKINLIEEQKPKLPLALFYSGKVYEFKDKLDDAFVDYRNMAIVTEKDSNYIPYVELAKISKLDGNEEKFKEYYDWIFRMKNVPKKGIDLLNQIPNTNIHEIVILTDVDNLSGLDSITCYINGDYVGGSMLTDAFQPGVTIGEVLRKTLKEATGYMAREGVKNLFGAIIPGGDILAKHIIGSGYIETRRWYYAPGAFWLLVTYTKGDLSNLTIKVWKRKKVVKTYDLLKGDNRLVNIYGHYFIHLRYQSAPYPDLNTIKRR